MFLYKSSLPLCGDEGASASDTVHVTDGWPELAPPTPFVTCQSCSEQEGVGALNERMHTHTKRKEQ